MISGGSSKGVTFFFLFLFLICDIMSFVFHFLFLSFLIAHGALHVALILNHNNKTFHLHACHRKGIGLIETLNATKAYFVEK
jgi:hypothetical protein